MKKVGRLEALLPDIDPDLAGSNPLTCEKLALALRDVLVQDDHTGTGSSRYSST